MPSTTTRGTGRFREVGRTAGPRRGGQGAGSGRLRPRRRRRHRHLRRQRHDPELPLPQPRGRHVRRGRVRLAGPHSSAEGIVTGSMGVDAADADGDGDPDLWVSNYEGETNELYLNDGRDAVHPGGHGERARPPFAPPRRLGDRASRPRPRREARCLRRERPPDAPPPPLPPRPAPAPVPPGARRAVRRGRQLLRAVFRRTAPTRGGGAPSATSTTTATSTSSSCTRTSPWPCSATTPPRRPGPQAPAPREARAGDRPSARG